MKLILLIIGLVLLIGTASATDYYVSTTGDNSSDGLTIGTAWQNITYGVSQLTTPGDTLYLINGTWNENTIAFPSSGNATHHIKLTSFNGTPTIQGDRSLSYQSGLNVIATSPNSYIDISNIIIKDQNLSSVLTVSSGHDVSIDNITIQGNGYWATGGGMGVSGYNITVTNSTFTDIGRNIIGLSLYQDAGIDKDSYNMTFQNNVFSNSIEHNLFDVFNNLYNDSVWIHDVYILNNTFIGGTHANQFYVHGANPHHVNNFTITGNTFRDGQNGLDGEYLKDSLISDNIFYNFSGYAFGSGSTRLRGNVTFRNNTATDYSTWPPIWSVGDGLVYFDSNTFASIELKQSAQARFTNHQNDSYYIRNSLYSNFTLNYTDGKVFKVTKTNAYTDLGILKYNNTESFIDIGHNNISSSTTTMTFTTYNITLKPISEYLKDVVVNTHSLVTDVSNITINSTVAENPTWINVTVANTSNTYNVSKDGIYYDSVVSGSDSVARYYYDVVGDEWSEHSFEFTWASTAGWSPTSNTTYFGVPENWYINGTRTWPGTQPSLGDTVITGWQVVSE